LFIIRWMLITQRYIKIMSILKSITTLRVHFEDSYFKNYYMSSWLKALWFDSINLLMQWGERWKLPSTYALVRIRTWDTMVGSPVRYHWTTKLPFWFWYLTGIVWQNQFSVLCYFGGRVTYPFWLYVDKFFYHEPPNTYPHKSRILNGI
jgi:hypothetical protein